MRTAMAIVAGILLAGLVWMLLGPAWAAFFAVIFACGWFFRRAEDR